MLENKIPPPVVLLICCILMWLCGKFGAIFDLSIELSFYTKLILIVVLVCLALAFMMPAVMSFKKSATTINPLDPSTASSLVTSGIYRLSRNPMYVGMAFLACAWGVYLANAGVLIVIILFVLFITRFQIIPEERAMQALFGEQYQSYKNQVRRWL